MKTDLMRFRADIPLLLEIEIDTSLEGVQALEAVMRAFESKVATVTVQLPPRTAFGARGITATLNGRVRLEKIDAD
jgi:hypothetical protein